MTLTYRTAGDWGAGKGGDLTPGEVDGNFYHLVQQIATLGDVTADEIAEISLVGSQLTFVLDSGATFGPFTVPRAAFRWRGDFAAGASVFGNDVIRVQEDGAADGLYFVRIAHTTVDPFDPARDDGAGPVYQLMFSWAVPAASLRPGVIEITDPGVTLDASHENAYLYSAGALTVTLPDAATDPLPAGFRCSVKSYAGNTLSIVAGGSATIEVVTGSIATALDGGTVQIFKLGGNEWHISGELAAAP